jgi:hypothetical protein
MAVTSPNGARKKPVGILFNRAYINSTDRLDFFAILEAETILKT